MESKTMTNRFVRRVATLSAAALFLVGGVSCMSLSCYRGNEASRVLHRIAVPAEAVTDFLESTDGSGNNPRRQSYSISRDGDFSFHSSVEREVGFIGARLTFLAPGEAERRSVEAYGGVLVTSVVSGSKAYDAGLRGGDVILSYDGRGGLSPELLIHLVQDSSPGSTVEVEYLRGKQKFQLQLEIDSDTRIESGQVFRKELEIVDDRRRSGVKLVQLPPSIRSIASPGGAEGLLVVDVLPGGPGFHADLRVGDLVTSVNGNPVATLEDFEVVSDALVPGEESRWSVRRRDKTVEVELETVEDAMREGGFNFLNLVEYANEPNHKKLGLVFGILLQGERCYGVKAAGNESRNLTTTSWAMPLNVLSYRGRSGGPKELRIAWILPLRWGRDEEWKEP